MDSDGQKEVQKESGADLEKAICMTGYGRFHCELFAVCALSLLSVGFQNGLSAYILPAAQCELHLTSFEVGLLNVFFLSGGILSSFLWGVLADSVGRRNILVCAHLSNAAVSVVCAVIARVSSLIVCRFINGFLIGAPGSIVFSYLAEFQPLEKRSSAVCYSGLFFTASWLILPLMAWLVLPLDIDLSLGDTRVFALTTWRLFVILLALAEVGAGLWMLLRLPESPRFLFANGRPAEALDVVREMFMRNLQRDPEEFPLKSLTTKGGGGLENRGTVVLKGDNCVGNRGKALRVAAEVACQFRRLFRPPLVGATVVVCGVMFANMFGVFGLGLWLPEVFSRFERFHALHPNATISIKALALLDEDLIRSTTTTPTTDDVQQQRCQFSFDSSVIRTTVAMGIASLLANVLSGLCAARLRPRTIPFVCMLAGGISSSTIYWLRSAGQNLVAAAIFQSTMVAANMSMGGVIVELFPTSVAGMAICSAMFVGRIGAMASNFAFGLWVDRHCEIPIFLVAASVLAGSVLCLLIPNRTAVGGGQDGGEKEAEVKLGVQVTVSVVTIDTRL